MSYSSNEFSENQHPCNSSHCPFWVSPPSNDDQLNLEGTEAENEAKMPCRGNDTVHIIKKGDTCWHLAQQYNTTIETIMAANPGMNCNALPVGAPLCIPKQVLHHCPPGTFPHVIKKGDTCWHIAQQYGTSIAAIMAVNPGMDCKNLPLGGILCIPHKKMNESNALEATCMAGMTPYVIKAGDTCYNLAKKYGTTVNAIIAANPGLNCNFLQIGSTICIPTTMTSCPVGTISYMIKQGDTCYSLANKYGTTVNAILAANPGLNCNFLQIGSTICIPTTMTSCPVGTISYMIKQGDTCYSLANKYGTTVNAILAANPGLNCNNLQIGATICIPTTPVTCGSGTFAYVIQPGDTCTGLAQKYGTTVSAIMAANPGINCNNLMVGATLCIPSICPMNTIPHVVQMGDTCYSLALKYNTTVADITAVNPGINCNYLQIGSIICIPATPPSTCPPGSIPIVIKAGDTCMGLAQKYGTTVNAIMAVNPGLNCNNLQVGGVICIPSTCPLGSVPYVIQPGDTCYALAQRFGTSVNAIIAANPGINCNNLQVGSTICIP